jgi:serine O-acetyltransferase
MFENIISDLRRYVKDEKNCSSKITYLIQFIPVMFFHEGAISLIAYRMSSYLSEHRFKFLAYILSKISFFITGNYIHHETKIGPSCKINHSCTVIHAQKIGKGFECSANVTIGQKIPYQSSYPVIGDFVMIGAGARILNDLGDEVIIGANSVITQPIETGKKAAGIPARIIGESKIYMNYYKSLITKN